MYLIEKLAAIAVILQTIELLQIRMAITDQGVWSWQVIKREFEIFPRPFQKALGAVLNYPQFIGLLWLRLLAGTLLLFFPHAAATWILVGSTLLISLRWRGIFNGGSDYMTLIVLSCLAVAHTFPESPTVINVCLGYLALQACLSYFIAGLVKVRQKGWRDGSALSGFLQSPVYSPPPLAFYIARSPFRSTLASWIVILFELSFPIAVFASPIVCLIYLGLALLFHLGNFYFFGLNRFVFAWAASYPAVYLISGYSFQ